MIELVTNIQLLSEVTFECFRFRNEVKQLGVYNSVIYANHEKNVVGCGIINIFVALHIC